MKYFITSDRHLFHRNMTKEGTDFLGRGFETLEDMTEAIVEAHNSVVGRGDITIDLGDIGLMASPQDIFDVYKRMKGAFIIIKGNHDNTKLLNFLRANNYKLPSGRDKFEIHEVGYRFKKNGKVFYCSHYPMMVGERGRTFSLHGHIHKYPSPLSHGINLGIDSPEIKDVVPFAVPLELDKAIELVVDKASKVEKTLYGGL